MGIWNASNCSGSTANNAVGCVAGELLAADLNLASGSAPSACVANAVQQANALLSQVSYIGPSGTYKLTTAQRTSATNIASTLDRYNNGSVNC